MALAMVSYNPILNEIEKDSWILKDFSLKTIDSPAYDTTTIILQYSINCKINCMLHASV